MSVTVRGDLFRDALTYLYSARKSNDLGVHAVAHDGRLILTRLVLQKHGTLELRAAVPCTGELNAKFRPDNLLKLRIPATDIIVEQDCLRLPDAAVPIPASDEAPDPTNIPDERAWSIQVPEIWSRIGELAQEATRKPKGNLTNYAFLVADSKGIALYMTDGCEAVRVILSTEPVPANYWHFIGMEALETLLEERRKAQSIQLSAYTDGLVVDHTYGDCATCAVIQTPPPSLCGPDKLPGIYAEAERADIARVSLESLANECGILESQAAGRLDYAEEYLALALSAKPGCDRLIVQGQTPTGEVLAERSVQIQTARIAEPYSIRVDADRFTGILESLAAFGPDIDLSLVSDACIGLTPAQCREVKYLLAFVRKQQKVYP